MTKHSLIGLEEQLQLRIDKAFRDQLDSVIVEMQKIALKFNVQQVQEKSPFKNVLSVSTEAMSSLEAIKGFIRYQVGRKESSRVWKLQITEEGHRQFFADAVVQQIDALNENCKKIFETIETDLEREIELRKDSSKGNNPQEIRDYLQQQKPSLLKKTHLNLTQLYLGYLSREHTALLGLQAANQDKSKK
ncbi:hypothetical protein IQ254_16770 [Nodosilinea sp. LEGE 07088]|uniref:hypothetical protein n=1 Tax=Nodosilinea sp. LEGE 07088 TaxID=2777968 RepID=UPI00187EF148|nr:hypothetical protein [Nodosilinea sp. LEGE 07088]MBE9138827.1 hypothetical protein [Nodosilinea sp. LEGE 07088]